LVEATPTVDQALSGPQSHQWRSAMQAELDQLNKYGVYKILDELPEGKTTVDTKWVLREKRDSQGEIIKYKARLTGRGFTQIKGLHYNETYALVARPESWRTLLAIAIQNQWDIDQLDIVAAYLNSILHHEIYIKDPKVTGGKVWKLVKALYGLKQSAYEWNGELTTVLHHTGLVSLNSDPACYHGKDSTGNYDIYIAIHVDDLLVIASSQERIGHLILSLEISLEVDRKGTPTKFLGIECLFTPDFQTIEL
jgi:hypothetical protein